MEAKISVMKITEIDKIGKVGWRMDPNRVPKILNMCVER